MFPEPCGDHEHFGWRVCYHACQGWGCRPNSDSEAADANQRSWALQQLEQGLHSASLCRQGKKPLMFLCLPSTNKWSCECFMVIYSIKVSFDFPELLPSTGVNALSSILRIQYRWSNLVYPRCVSFTFFLDFFPLFCCLRNSYIKLNKKIMYLHEWPFLWLHNSILTYIFLDAKLQPKKMLFILLLLVCLFQ